MDHAVPPLANELARSCYTRPTDWREAHQKTTKSNPFLTFCQTGIADLFPQRLPLLPSPASHAARKLPIRSGTRNLQPGSGMLFLARSARPCSAPQTKTSVHCSKNSSASLRARRTLSVRYSRRETGGPCCNYRDRMATRSSTTQKF